MRVLCAFGLAACLSVLASALAADRAAALVRFIPPPSAPHPQLVLEAGIVCGTFDGHFTCKNDSGAAAQFGKNASPGARVPSPDETPQDLPGGTWQGTTDQGGASDAATTCQHGMVGTPPNCQCPKSSELLGGNCVHYTASACSNGLASNAMPQACQSAEEKVSCIMRQDGLKDCCCVTYDKF